MTESGLEKENMINMIMKINFVLALIVLMGFSTHAQSKFGADSLLCVENRSIYVQNFKAKNYSDALKPWRWAWKNCPEANENTFRHGPKIIKSRMKVDKQNKAAYIDTLMMIFDQRIQYFGKEGYVLGLKGYELVMVDKKRSAEALSMLDKSISLEGNKAGPQAVFGYMKAIGNLVEIEEKNKEDLLEAYSRVSEVIDYNIVNESKSTKHYIHYAKKIEEIFTPYANCEDLVPIFSAKFDPLTNDISFLNRVIEMLEKEDCSSEQLFFDASSRLYELDPSASSSNKMAKMSIAKGKSNDAIKFAKKAIELEEDSDKKAKYFLGLANAYRNKGSYVSARNAVYSALEHRRGWGEAYINLGSIYVAGAKNCGNKEFEQKTVYWIAVDNFEKALNDEDTKERASRSINIYSRYFPTTTLCFEYSPPYNKRNGFPDKHVIITGDKYNLECWINKSTTVRTSDEIE